jgi:hypothetical protein
MGAAKTSAAAVWSLILGVLSLLCCCVTGLPGLILGIVALVNIGKSQGRLKGKGLALAGILFSCILTVVNGAALWSLRTSSDPQIRKFFDNFGEIFKTGQEMAKGTTQATEMATALKAYADSHAGQLPPDLETLVTENLLGQEALASPVGGDGAAFWELTEAGSKVSDLAPTEVVVKGGPLEMMGQQLYVVIRANWTVEGIPATQLK